MEIGREGIAGNGAASLFWKGELADADKQSTSLRCFSIVESIFW